jgi:CRP-like cAMP-binding protein
MQEMIVDFKKGDVLFKEGDNSKDLYIIQEGIVRVFRQSDGGQILPLALIHAGGFVGEMSFFDGKPRSATADAITDVRALKLESAKLEKEIKRLPSWVMVMVRGLADRVREANDLVKRHGIVDESIAEQFSRWKAGV